MTLTKSGILGPALPWGNEDVEVEDGGKEADEKEVDEEKEGKEEAPTVENAARRRLSFRRLVVVTPSGSVAAS